MNGPNNHPANQVTHVNLAGPLAEPIRIDLPKRATRSPMDRALVARLVAKARALPPVRDERIQHGRRRWLPTPDAPRLTDAILDRIIDSMSTDLAE
jgi:hypothetical protein